MDLDALLVQKPKAGCFVDAEGVLAQTGQVATIVVPSGVSKYNKTH